MTKLTDRTLLPADQISDGLLVHVVDPNDATQDAAGSSFKGIISILGAPSSVKEGLVIIRNAVTPNSQIDIDATKLSIGRAVVSSVNLTVDITASGANGLDTGSEATSTWYSIWAIYNPTTSIVAGLLSASLTSPTLPAGYIWARRVGFVYNDSGGGFVNFNIINNSFYPMSDSIIESTITPTTFTTVAVPSQYMPTIQTEIQVSGYLQVTYNTMQAPGTLLIRPVGSSSSGILIGSIEVNSVSDTDISGSCAFIITNSSRQFQYSLACTESIDIATIYLVSFNIPDLSIF